jgi:DNA-binding NtrC family response regulator
VDALMKKVIVIDDDRAILNFIKLFLLQTGKFEVTVLQDSRKGYEYLDSGGYDILILDMDMPHVSGLDILEHLNSRKNDIVTIVITGVEDIDLAIRAMKLKILDYVLKPIDEERIQKILNLAIDKVDLKYPRRVPIKPVTLASLVNRDVFKDIKTRNEEITKIFHFVEKFAPTENSILIWGESGTGKELIAKAIHSISNRRDHKFVAVNAGSFANDLFASEFFGHEKGAFTGALSEKRGFIEEAAGGTLFLDEIGELSLPIQVKLLRVLQEEEFYKLGSTKNQKSNVRIIAATNKNLFDEINKGNFRKDLFFRLNINSIFIPPLRERKEDIELLAYSFLETYNKKYEKNVKTISPKVIELLLDYDFPGNVRELMNIINSSIIIESGEELDLSSLPHYFHEHMHTKKGSDPGKASEPDRVQEHRDGSTPLLSLDEIEREHIIRVLKYTNSNKSQAAKILGISRVSIIAKIKRYGIEK